MNLTRPKSISPVARRLRAPAAACLGSFVALVLLHSWNAAAQATNSPAIADYSAFRIVADRNIFNPNRYAHTNGRRSTASRSAPAFSLVGTMTGRNGMLAFFDGTDSDYRKVLAVNGTIAGYQVTAITLNGVRLTSTNKPVELAVGDRMRREGNAWQPADQGDLPASATESETPPSDQAPAPSDGGEANDVLKKLMQQREQEMK